MMATINHKQVFYYGASLNIGQMINSLTINWNPVIQIYPFGGAAYKWT